jgi:hypothetical protein
MGLRCASKSNKRSHNGKHFNATDRTIGLRNQSPHNWPHRPAPVASDRQSSNHKTTKKQQKAIHVVCQQRAQTANHQNKTANHARRKPSNSG